MKAQQKPVINIAQPQCLSPSSISGNDDSILPDEYASQ